MFNLFDTIKNRLNPFLLKGLDKFSGEGLSDMRVLKDKLETMNLKLISELLEKFISSLDNLNKTKKDNALKMEVSKQALQLVATTRMFETIMNLESVKQDLLLRIDE